MNKPGPILFIVEGKKDDGRFIEKCWRSIGLNIEKRYYEYGTNLASLFKLMFKDDTLDDMLDVQNILLSNEKDPDKRKILEKKYSDIYLVFDLDPQDRTIYSNLGKLIALLDHFNDSTDQGKMYINYPMLESYRHITTDISAFYDLKIKKEMCTDYKMIVDRESKYKDPSKCEGEELKNVICMHLCKANMMLGNSISLPTQKEFFDWRQTDILNNQIESLKVDDSIFVLNTCIFNVVEYKPSLFISSKNENDEPDHTQ